MTSQIKDEERLTLEDVARVAGVSKKTVSRVLNNERYVKSDTRDRVNEAVKALNFKPNIGGRLLRKAHKQSFLIALLHDNPDAHYLGRLLTQVLNTCDEKGYRLIVESMPSERLGVKRRSLPSFINRNDLDGVIVTPPLSDDLNLIERIEKAGHTVVRIAPFFERERTPYIFMDDHDASYKLTKNLYDLGHKHIAHIKGSESHGSSVAREAGFSLACSELGIKYTVYEGDYTFVSAMASANEILTSNTLPSAIFAANDEMAAAVIFVVGRFGLTVPDDISVVGFDDIPLASIIEPGITTVRQPLGEMANEAVNLIIQRREQNEDSTASVRSIQVDAPILIRASTGAPRGS